MHGECWRSRFVPLALPQACPPTEAPHPAGPGSRRFRKKLLVQR